MFRELARLVAGQTHLQRKPTHRRHMGRTMTAGKSLLVALLGALALTAGCGDDDDNGGMMLMQSYTYSEAGDCSALSGLPQEPSGVQAPTGTCRGTQFNYGDAVFIFATPDGDGSWKQNPGCPLTLDTGKAECVPGGAFRFTFDCNGCQGTVTVGNP